MSLKKKQDYLRHFWHPAFMFLSVFVRGTGWGRKSGCLASDRSAGLGCAGAAWPSVSI